MPKCKQPTRLQKMAFDALVTYAVLYCDKLSVDGTLAMLRKGIAHVKQLVFGHLPAVLFAEFCRRFLEKFYWIGSRRSERRPDSHYGTSLEIMMDIEIVGLRCGGDILRYLNPRDAHRLQRLKILDLNAFWEKPPKRLDNFRLQDLTTFIFPRFCTDPDLVIIGTRCLKLQILDINESVKVTDRGLRALSPCTEMRVVNLHYCSVSNAGVNELLSVHKRLEEFNIGKYYTYGEKSFDVLSRPSSLVCPSVKRFSIKSTPVTDAHLQSVVTLFPNLTHLRICCKLTGNLCALKNLAKLKEINFSYGYRCFTKYNLKELLITIGANISILNMHCCSPNIYLKQDDLDFIFKYCENIECMGFDYEPDQFAEKLIIPSFKKLKNFKCTAITDGSSALLEFGEMLELEILTIHGFDDIFEMTESMILDHVKFPNLKEIRTFYNPNEKVNRIKQIAKSRNLDFCFKFTQ